MTSSINLLSNFLDTATLRHKVHSNNIANVNTPNYKRQVVAFEEEMKRALDNNKPGLPLRITNEKHLPVHTIELEPAILMDKNTFLRTDGNNVDIDMELALLAENTIKFNVLSQSISKKLGLLSAAVRGGR